MDVFSMGVLRQVFDDSVCKSGAGSAPKQLCIVDATGVECVDLDEVTTDDIQTGDAYPVLNEMGTDCRRQ